MHLAWEWAYHTFWSLGSLKIKDDIQQIWGHQNFQLLILLNQIKYQVFNDFLAVVFSLMLFIKTWENIWRTRSSKSLKLYNPKTYMDDLSIHSSKVTLKQTRRRMFSNGVEQKTDNSSEIYKALFLIIHHTHRLWSPDVTFSVSWLRKCRNVFVFFFVLCLATLCLHHTNQSLSLSAACLQRPDKWFFSLGLT